MSSFEATVRIMLQEYYEGKNHPQEQIAGVGQMFIDDMNYLFHPLLLEAQEKMFLLNIYRAWVPIAVKFMGMQEERMKVLAKNCTLFLKFHNQDTLKDFEVIKETTNVISLFGNTVH